MRLLVTGAAGFLGRNVLLAVPASWEVIALYRPGNADFYEFVSKHRLEHVRALPCDLTERVQIERVMSRVGGDFHACLALASNTSIPGSIQQPVADLHINVLGLLHLLQTCRCQHLVYLSSGAVYIGLNGLVKPGVAVSPTLPYAISKLAAEQYVRALLEHHQNPARATILRFFGAYGPYEPPRKLYTRLVRRFAFERNPSFTVLGDGENYIDAMYIDDAVRALLKVLDAPPSEPYRWLDLGVGGGETVNQVVTRAARAFGLEPRIRHEGSSPEYIRFTIDPEPFASLYHFQPRIALEDGLRSLATHLVGEGAESV